jgi:very-short-patch-repair endonuclease
MTQLTDQKPSDLLPADPRTRTCPRTLGQARRLRGDATSSERLLWERLRDGRFRGLKFRRQHPIGPHIADFYCADLRLVIELDGAVHRMQRQRDANRDVVMTAAGPRVLRIDVDNPAWDIEDTLARIGGLQRAGAGGADGYR